MKNHSLFLLAFLLNLTALSAATISMTGSNTGTESSFNSADDWSVAAAPAPGNDYFNTRYVMRTPASNSAFTFQGDSLTLGDGVQTTALLAFKGIGTIRVDDFIVNFGSFSNFIGDGAANTGTLAGQITIQSGGLSSGPGANRYIDISATISGMGTLRSLGGVNTLLSANDWTGGTQVEDTSILVVEADSGLGMGDVSVLSGGALTLQNGTLDDYIHDGAGLLLAGGLADSSINLNFSGIDTIGALSLDGGINYVAPGLYSVTALNTAYGSNVFTGAGQLQVVPEPTSAALLLLAGGVLAYLNRKRVRV